MRPAFHGVEAVSATQTMVEARRLQGRHGAGVLAAVVERVRRALASNRHPQVMTATGQLRIH